MKRPGARPSSVALLLLLAALPVAWGCDPYDDFGADDESFGPIDPILFPAANLGTGGDRTRPGRGRFVATPAFADGMPVGYFAYAFPASAATADPLRLLDDGKAFADRPIPAAQVFDPIDGVDPFPAMYPCTPPPGYRPDQRRDEVKLNEQGNIFSALPEATYSPGVAATSSYLPVVRQIRQSSSGRPCQQVKSVERARELLGEGMASERFLAWLIIDAAAAVYPTTGPGPSGPTMNPGVGLQNWGWFKRYLIAYLDGGYIPTMETTTMTMPPRRLVRMVPQRLYHPRRVVVTDMAGTPVMDPMTGMPMIAAGARGAGYDVLRARRSDQDYSPVCEVFTYETGAPPAMPGGMPGPPLLPAQLPKDEEAIMAMFNMTLMPAAGAARYVFCLQVKGQVTP
jgi:hypothetical protein